MIYQNVTFLFYWFSPCESSEPAISLQQMVVAWHGSNTATVAKPRWSLRMTHLRLTLKSQRLINATTSADLRSHKTIIIHTFLFTNNLM